MKIVRTIVFASVIAVPALGFGSAVANAARVDFGTDEASCKAAEHQLHAQGDYSADCFQTGPGYYTLDY